MLAKLRLSQSDALNGTYFSPIRKPVAPYCLKDIRIIKYPGPIDSRFSGNVFCFSPISLYVKY